MAKIISPPKPRAVALPPPPPPPPPSPALAPGPDPVLPPAGPAADAPSVDAAVSAAAGTSLLRRTLGRAGTVLTGWRGILAPGSLAPRRKTLMGG
ncbi:MAG: hypothetical protein RLY86_4470 [Pseudomonadota bacterium]